MTALHALARKGRYWIVLHKWKGWHVIDSHAERAISRTLGNFMSPFDAWRFIQTLATHSAKG